MHRYTYTHAHIYTHVQTYTYAHILTYIHIRTGMRIYANQKIEKMLNIIFLYCVDSANCKGNLILREDADGEPFYERGDCSGTCSLTKDECEWVSMTDDPEIWRCGCSQDFSQNEVKNIIVCVCVCGCCVCVCVI